MKHVEYQSKYVKKLTDTAVELLEDEFQQASTIVFQAPTGSGKTYMISQALAAIVKEIEEPFSFIWISVNTLHEQSRQNLSRYLEDERLLDCISIDEIQNNLIEENEIVFFNWDSLIKSNNVFRMENENDWNLQTVVANTRDEGRRIILIIDESHRTASAKRALDVIAEISPTLTIEVTATPKQVSGTLIKIPLQEVIQAGMIKSEVQINPDAKGVREDKDFLDAALKKRRELKRSFEAMGKSINPLLLIQIPNKRAGDSSNPEDYIESLLEERGVSTRSGSLAVWLSEKKENRELVELDDSPVDVLIFKEAIALGWDCPRAAILFLQREWRHERYVFNIQTLGRIMRMPEQVHYDAAPELNVGYVYSASDNFEIVKELASDYVSSLQMVRDEDRYERPLKITSEFIRRKVELTRLSAAFKSCLFEAAAELKTKTLINEKVKENQKVIGIKGRVEVIDKEQKVTFDETLKIRKGVKQIADDYTRFAMEQSRPFMPGRSSQMIKSSLRSWFKDTYDIADEDVVARVVMQRLNKPKFKALISRAKEIYENRPTRSDEILLNPDWEIPETVSLFKDFTAIPKSSKSILKEPESGSYFVKVTASGKPDISTPEATFISLLEDSDDELQWWFKNGTRDSKYFSIAYTRLDGRSFGFYPDFLLKVKGELLIVEIKDDKNLSSDNLLKLKAGREYLARHSHSEKLRFFILSPDVYEDFFHSLAHRKLDEFTSSFEESLLRYFKSSQIVLESKTERTEKESLELELLDELDKTIAELEDTKLRNELLQLDLQQAQANLDAMGKAFAKKPVAKEGTFDIPLPFEICVLGEVSNQEIAIQKLQTLFAKFGVGTNDWHIKFFNNTKLQNSDVLRMLIRDRAAIT